MVLKLNNASSCEKRQRGRFLKAESSTSRLLKVEYSKAKSSMSRLLKAEGQFLKLNDADFC